MALTFSGNIGRDSLARAVAVVEPLVASPEVSAAWSTGSALPGMTVGGLTRHLVSQPECAVEFLGIQPVPEHAPVVSLADLYARSDWFTAPVDAEENTSICDDFNDMSSGGPSESLSVLRASAAALPAALAGVGPTTYVPWQDCALDIDDFLVVRLLEIVVHADDLAVSVGLPTPEFDDDVTDPVLALLAVLSARRHGCTAALRALSRTERTPGPAAAF